MIKAPNLERLHIIDYALVSYMLHELHSLTEVFIDVSYVDGPLTQAKRVLELLEGVNEVKFMSLSAETMLLIGLTRISFQHSPTWHIWKWRLVELHGSCFLPSSIVCLI